MDRRLIGLMWLLMAAVACSMGSRVAFADDEGEALRKCYADGDPSAQAPNRVTCNLCTPRPPINGVDPHQFWTTFVNTATVPPGVCSPFGGVYTSRSWQGDCSTRPSKPASQRQGTSGDRCENYCAYTLDCTGQTLCEVSFPGKSYTFGAWKPNGNTCVSGDPPPSTDPDPPCDPDSGVCYYPSGPKFCGTTADGVVCVPSPRPTHGPDCGTGDTSAVCAGTPSDPTAPPPTPPNPPIPPNTPPDQTINVNVITGTGVGGGPITINVTNNNNNGGGGDDGGGGDPGGGGENGGGGSGQGGEVCPDGSAPVNGQCAAHGTCADGSAPVNGQCNGTQTCSNGQPPVNGSCSGDGNCSNGQPPVNGQCPVTCPNGATPVNGQCPPTYQPCQDGSQPVNGQCPAGHCNPVTDPNHCENGQAGGGEGCEAAPSCNGDPIACATLYQSWATKCEVHKLNPEHSPGDDEYGPVNSDSHAIWNNDGDVDPADSLDTSGFGYSGGGGACPDLPTVEFLSQSYSLADYLPCDPLRILAAMILLAAYVQAAYIIGRS